MKDELRRLWNTVIPKTVERSRIYGTLGKRLSDGSYDFVVRGQPNFLHVTLRLSSGAQTVVPARNDARLGHQAKLGVVLEMEDKTYVIIRASGRQDMATPIPTDPSGVGPHTHNSQYYLKSEFIDFSDGAADAGKPIKLDAGGKLDASLIDAEDISDIVGTMVTGNTETDIAVTYQDADNTLDFVVSPTLVADRIGAAATDDTIADADVFGYVTGGTLVKTAWSNIKAVLSAVFFTFTNKIEIAATATTGSALKVIRNLTSTSTDSPVVDIVQDHASDDQAAIRVQQDGAGDIAAFLDGATEVLVIEDGGQTILRRGSAGILLNLSTLSITESGTLFQTGFREESDGTARFAMVLLAATSAMMGAAVSGDTFRRVVIQADGKILWGDGTAARDTNLYRASADLLATDDTFRVGAFFRLVETTVTIASGAITITSSLVKIDTEASAATDDLDTINGGTVDGTEIIIRTTDDSRDVVVRHNGGGTGNIRCAPGGANFTLASRRQYARLVYFAADSVWIADHIAT